MGKRRWPWQSQKQVEWKAGTDDEAPVYVIETHSRDDISKVRAQITDLLPDAVPIESVFPSADQQSEDERIGEAFDLCCFWAARLPGPAFADWNESPYDLAYELAAMDGVRSVEPDLPTGFYSTTSSSALGSSCEAPKTATPKDRAWALRQMRVPDAWAALRATGVSQGKDILVGQPDTGIATHIDLDGCIDERNGFNLIETGKPPRDPLTGPRLGKNQGHGTAVSSVAVSRGTVLVNPGSPDFGIGGPGFITGVSTEATVVPVRAIRSVVRLTQVSVARAVDLCRREKLHVISMSLGGLPMRCLEAAIASAVKEQLIVVCAAGNCVRLVVWPARYPMSIALGGTNEQTQPWRGTSRGKRVDVSAPAELVWHALRESPTDPPDPIDSGQGTSFATAMTAGAAALWLNDRRDALIRSLARGATLQELFRACLKSTACAPPGWDKRKFGAGIVNAEKLVSCGVAAAAGMSANAPDRQDYGAEVADSAAQVLDELPAHPNAALTQALMQLSPSNREKFGHEALALISQNAWMATSGDAQTAADLGIPVLKPSRALRAVLVP